MTYQELRDRINNLDPEELNMEATVLLKRSGELFPVDELTHTTEKNIIKNYPVMAIDYW